MEDQPIDCLSGGEGGSGEGVVGKRSGRGGSEAAQERLVGWSVVLVLEFPDDFPELAEGILEEVTSEGGKGQLLLQENSFKSSSRLTLDSLSNPFFSALNLFNHDVNSSRISLSFSQSTSKNPFNQTLRT